MTIRFAEARFVVADAATLVSRVCDDLSSHGAALDESGSLLTLTFGWGKCHVTVAGDETRLLVEADTATGIAVVREEVASHFIEYAPALENAIRWSDAAEAPVHPAWFCLVTVCATRQVSANMRRITFAGADFQRYAGFDNIHVRLMFPLRADLHRQWPTVSPNGVTRYPPDDVVAIRKYTIRNIDVEAGSMDIDFVLHADGGPGAGFALNAKPGDVIGLAGPGGRSVPVNRDWYLLAGDETALPAIARILETLPQTARGLALIEVDGAADELALSTRTGIAVRWLHRNGRPAGTTDILPGAVASASLPNDGSSIFVWAGCEMAAFRKIRQHLRMSRAVQRDDHLVVSYWTRNRD